MLDLEPIKARAARATPGPWRAQEDHVLYPLADGTYAALLWSDLDASKTWPQGDHDADFVAEAREDIPLLLVEVERLRAENAALRARSAKAPRRAAPGPG